LFDNANVYVTKKTARWKIANDRHMKKINHITVLREAIQCLLSIKYLARRNEK